MHGLHRGTEPFTLLGNRRSRPPFIVRIGIRQVRPDTLDPDRSGTLGRCKSCDECRPFSHGHTVPRQSGVDLGMHPRHHANPLPRRDDRIKPGIMGDRDIHLIAHTGIEIGIIG